MFSPDDGGGGAALDVEPAVAVEAAQVAGLEPAVLGECGGCGLGVLEIAAGDIVSLDGDLADSGLGVLVQQPESHALDYRTGGA